MILDEDPGRPDVGFYPDVALDKMRAFKPNDRSEADRLIAIAITDMQKICAWWDFVINAMLDEAAT